MTRIVSVVEGHGEVAALPLLLRRMAEWRTPGSYVDVQRPIRVSRDRFLNRQEEFERHIQFAGSKCGDGGWLLVLLDADDGCPAQIGPATLERARGILPNHSISVVFANREFEAWFIGAAESLIGERGLAVTPGDLKINPEIPRDAKGWLGARMGRTGYGETTDQPAFASRMSLQQAVDRCPSFQKLCREWDRHFAAPP